MNIFETENFPQWAVYYAAYGEFDSISEEDKNMVDKFIEENNLCDLIDCSDETNFSAYPDFGLACEVVKATFVMKEI